MKLRIILLLGLFGILGGNASAFTFDDLEALIRRHHLTSIDALIPELPRELRSNFTLMYQSRSLQQATYRFPRAVLFGLDASLILAFNSDPSSEHYYDLEAIQYRPVRRAFEFREITFPRAPSQKVVVSERNPKLCLTCHGSDPRPNWAGYDQWPGSFGANDDFPAGADLDALLSFKKEGMNQGRFESLELGFGSAASPFEVTGRGRLRFRPNLRFLLATMALNAERGARLLQEHPKYHKFKYLFLESALRCTTGIDPKRELDAIFPTAPGIPDTVPLVNQIPALVGISPKAWTLDVGSTDYWFWDGGGTTLGYTQQQSDLVAIRIAEDLMHSLPGLRAAYKPLRYYSEARFKEADDHPYAVIADTMLRDFDFGEFQKNCAALANAYSKEPYY